MGYAIVTGASKGIGKEIARELARRKFDILLVARSEQLLQDTAKEIREQFGVTAAILPLDLSMPGAAQTLCDWCQKNNYAVEVLVNNAGYGLSGPFEKYSLDAHDAMMQVNISTLVSLCHLFLPGMKKLPQAYILNIASTTAYQSVPGLALYAASKSFVLSFSRTLSFELRKTTVSVTCISPGSTDTDFVNRANMGAKTKKTADRFNMTPAAVAAIAVNAMFRKKTEVIAGGVNKFGAFLVWLLPKRLVERQIAKIYEIE
jgi:short-subunit dehydrogenase